MSARPNIAPRTPVSVRLPSDIYNRLSAIADAEDRSLNAQIIRALREWLTHVPPAE